MSFSSHAGHTDCIQMNICGYHSGEGRCRQLICIHSFCFLFHIYSFFSINQPLDKPSLKLFGIKANGNPIAVSIPWFSENGTSSLPPPTCYCEAGGRCSTGHWGRKPHTQALVCLHPWGLPLYFPELLSLPTEFLCHLSLIGTLVPD